MRISDWSSDVCSSDLSNQLSAQLWACAGTVVPHAATTAISEIIRRDNKRDMADVLGLEMRSRGVSPPCSIPLRIGWRTCCDAANAGEHGHGTDADVRTQPGPTLEGKLEDPPEIVVMVGSDRDRY